MNNPLTPVSQAGHARPDEDAHDGAGDHASARVHDHADGHDSGHGNGQTHDHSHDHDPRPARPHTHHAHAAPAVVPAAHMAWSVLSLSVFQRLMLIVPMLVCLWLAVIWAIAG